VQLVVNWLIESLHESYNGLLFTLYQFKNTSRKPQQLDFLFAHAQSIA